jgi:hypothetical protein
MSEICIMSEKADTYKILIENPGSKQLGRPRCRWENDTKLNLNEKWYEDMDWIELV